VPRGFSTDDLAKLRASQEDKHRLVTIVVTGCAYSCCGKGWQRRDDHEQTYTGYIDNLQEPGNSARDESAGAGTFMLYSAGIGTLSYVVACRDYELADVDFA
jgi:hypothetical protein